MLTKQIAKSIRELHEKKRRQETGLFLVEGGKSVAELLKSDFAIERLFVTSSFLADYKDLIRSTKQEYDVVEPREIENMGTLESNDAALAVVRQKENDMPLLGANDIAIMLDGIRDPGNLGTIARTADWFGIRHIILSPDSVDFYNPKTIAATKGSFVRISPFYADLAAYLATNPLPVMGAFLDGENIGAVSFPPSGILLLGSESHGISSQLERLVTKKITIPGAGTAESLNVGIAAGIILDRWLGSRP